MTEAQHRALTVLVNEGAAAWVKATNIALRHNMIKKGLVVVNPETNKYEAAVGA